MSEPVFFARVKPYNPKRGHVVRRIVCLGTLWEGGSGVPPDTIPGWTKVNAAQAEVLKKFRQKDNDPFSDRVFDIVTPTKRKEIDLKEEQYRKSVLGIGSTRAINELPNVSAREVAQAGTGTQPIKPDGSRMTLADLQDAPAPALPVQDIADDSDVGGLDRSTEAHINTQAQERDLGGRMDAAADLNAEIPGVDVEPTVETPEPEAKPKPRTRRRGRRKNA